MNKTTETIISPVHRAKRMIAAARVDQHAPIWLRLMAELVYDLILENEGVPAVTPVPLDQEWGTRDPSGHCYRAPSEKVARVAAGRRAGHVLVSRTVGLWTESE